MEPGPWCVFCERHIETSGIDPVSLEFTPFPPNEGPPPVAYVAHASCIRDSAPPSMRRYIDTYWPVGS